MEMYMLINTAERANEHQIHNDAYRSVYEREPN